MTRKFLKVAVLALGLAIFAWLILNLPSRDRGPDVSVPKASGEMPGPSAEVPLEDVYVPILLYHDVAPGEDSSAISPENLERHLIYLRDNGYTAVSFDELIAFVYDGTPLPEKPVCITFDDGYYNNYKEAFPLLKEYEVKATIFPIGTSVGSMVHYEDTDFPITPHFGVAEMCRMLSSGLVFFQSHTFDMHQWAPYETGRLIRENIAPLQGESEDNYRTALIDDFNREATILRQAGVEKITVVAFPHGIFSELTNTVLRKLGVKVTLTTDSTRANIVSYGKPDSLINMGRLTLHNETDDDVLTDYLNSKLETGVK